jgi:metallo-beta-lactamase class B
MKRLFSLLMFIWVALAVNAQLVGDTIHISSDLYLVRLADNCYAQVSYAQLPQYGRVGANGLLLVDNKKAIIVNTPWNNQLTKQLHQYLTSKGISLDHAVITHWHDDCLGGLGYLQQQFILSTSSQRTYDASLKHKLPVAFIRFKDTLTFNFEGQSIQCFYPGAGHTADNIVVYLPKKNVLYGGCIIKDMASNTLGNTGDAVLADWPASVANIRRKYANAAIVVPGHGQWGNLSLLDHTLKLLNSK